MPQFWGPRYPEGFTADEFHGILRCRRETLAMAASQTILWQDTEACDLWGWKAYWRSLGRDRDGSLRVRITVRCPSGDVVMIRNVRLVRQNPLPSTLRKDLRES